MENKMTHAEFIDHLKQFKMFVKEITPTDVIFHSEHLVINKTHIDFHLHVIVGDEMFFVGECLQQGKPIHLIKLVREHTGMGLKEAKDLCDEAKHTWIKNHVDSIPFDKLPLEINKPYCDQYMAAIKYRLQNG